MICGVHTGENGRYERHIDLTEDMRVWDIRT
jgi:hypothetical protein